MAPLPQYNSFKNEHPFGMLMPGRSYSSTAYKYGFNGKEKDDEVKGSGNSLNFGARIHDPRLGRFLSLDPLSIKYQDLNPYHFCANSPLLFIEKDGADFFCYNTREQKSVLQVLRQTFGERANGFSFDNNGKLNYTQPTRMNVLNPSQTIVFNYFLQKTVNNTSNVHEFDGFGFPNWTDQHGDNYTLEYGNAATSSDHDPPTNTVKSRTAIGSGTRGGFDDEEGVKITRATSFFHEIAHPIAILKYNGDGADAQKWTVGFENIVRDIFNLNPREGKNHGQRDANDILIPSTTGTNKNPDDYKDAPSPADFEDNVGTIDNQL